MAQADVVAYNIAAFLATLFLLEFGADKFIDHTAVIARRTGVSETVIGLITAGGEWEELAVVVASLARGRSSLAIGNIIGAAISNILGAFSLGLVFYERGKPIEFDRSSRIYSLFLLILTTFVTPVAYFSKYRIWLVCGSLLVAIFTIYLLAAGVAIGKGVLTPPEDSDDDSDDNVSDASSAMSVSGAGDQDQITVATNTRSDAQTDGDKVQPSADSLPTSSLSSGSPEPRPSRKQRRLRYHVFYLLVGFLSICLAGYVLSQAATNITDQFGISDVLFGVIILAIATTLPEKFVAVMSGHRGHPGILVANCVGSNVFLLALCVSIIMLSSRGTLDAGNVTIAELVVLWTSTLAVTLTVWFGGRFCRWIGVLMLASYVVFIVLEFTIIHRVAD
ncbi:Sodium/calcium exchanger protein-domain-containing protein [Fusarium redolens]|uniref:Sodium/calcium exchanger protein-domain-containing protein n=1 Tax=Fusarium redolens TaxID=48865 RepID=A0A9P9JRL3_FUSRE|nr:Sodium/calcium exchanger protein-domain-containing protein [Fusarium redolens]KAH7230636.1 Sodium/calcium exchanger protein-domain-containing protein [Fusarium redolens]